MAKIQEAMNPEEMTTEERFDAALQYMSLAANMSHNLWAEKYYNKALKLLKPMKNEHPEAKAKIKEARIAKYTVRAEAQVRKYHEAVAARDAAKTEDQMRQVIRQFHEIAEYSEKYVMDEKYLTEDLKERLSHCTDSAEQEKNCQDKLQKIQNRRLTRNFAVLGVAAVLIVGAFFFSKTPSFDRTVAKIQLMTGNENGAWARYKAAWTDSGLESDHQIYLETRYEAAVHSYEAGDYETAYSTLKVLAVEENYLDSADYFTVCEQRRLAEAEIGATLAYGDSDWIVLDRKDGRVLLLKSKACGARTFAEAEGDVTWENSSARAWLNSEFMEAHFTEAERNAIAVTEVTAEDSEMYGTDAGSDTKDQIFLLSVSEVETYYSRLKETSKSWWLRTPGATGDAMALVNNEKLVLAYGADAHRDTDIRLKPAMWVCTGE